MLEQTLRKSRNYAVAQTLFLLAFAAAVFLAKEPRLFAAGPPETAGTALCAVGVVLMFSAFASIGSSVQISPEPKAGGELATKGVYRRFRHPIYTAIVLLVLGLFLRQPTVPVLIVAAVVIAFLVVKSRFEEQLLLERYPEYAEYGRRTWGVLTGLGRRPGA